MLIEGDLRDFTVADRARDHARGCVWLCGFGFGVCRLRNGCRPMCRICHSCVLICCLAAPSQFSPFPPLCLRFFNFVDVCVIFFLFSFLPQHGVLADRFLQRPKVPFVGRNRMVAFVWLLVGAVLVCAGLSPLAQALPLAPDEGVFLHVTDIHMDVRYTPGSPGHCIQVLF